MAGLASGSKRYFVLACVAFMLGIYFFHSTEISLSSVFYAVFFLSAAAFVLMLAGIILNIFHIKSPILKIKIGFGLSKSATIIKIFFITALCCIFFLTGFLRTETVQYILTSNAERLGGKSCFSKIMVVSEPFLNSKETSVLFDGKLVSYIDRGEVFGEGKSNIRIHMFCTYPGALNLKPGDIIETFCTFSVPDTAEAYDDFDYNMYLRQLEISITGFSKYVRLSSEPYSYGFKDKLIIIGYKIRKSIYNSIEACFGFSEDYQALLKSILTGNKRSMRKPLKNAMAKSGIIHISAVSGMHISILFSAVSAVLGMARLKRELIFIIFIPVLLIFMTVASFSPSVMRAAIMLILFIAAYLLERDRDSITALFAAALIILFMNPYTLLSASFLLSFGSSLSILVFASLIRREMPLISRIPLIGNFIADSFSVTLSSFMGTAYFSLYFFGYIVFSGLVVNLWVIPTVSVLFCGGYLICGLSLPRFNAGAAFIKYIITPLIELILRTAYFFGNVPALYPYIKTPHRLEFVIYIILLFFIYGVLRLRADKQKRRE